MEYAGNIHEFYAPSGNVYAIREQNGSDDDTLSNSVDAKTLKNFAKFISSIVINTTYTESGKLSVEEAYNMPVLDKYCILLNSRIHSIGAELEFTHDWGDDGGKQGYVLDLNQLLFDYSKVPTAEELVEKDDAIPYYPEHESGKHKDIPFTIGNKEFLFDRFTTKSEAYILSLPQDQMTKNKDLIARNLRFKAENGNWDKVTNFSFFTLKEMIEIRKYVNQYDPVFTGQIQIQNTAGTKSYVNIFGLPGFFYPGEM